VAQEGLRNALRHAEATQLSVLLRLSTDLASLTIRDNGRGFAVSPSLTALTKSNHFGLVGMAERVALAGGQLAIRSQIERGTTLFLQLPLVEGVGLSATGQIELTSTLILHTNSMRRKESQ
jgi:signal transduction histidine kinase